MKAVRRALACAIAAALLLTTAAPAHAQSTEERFHDLFVTAGYSTAFGAALGTAFLAFKKNPSENLQSVAIGASLGFIGGSILGSYVIFSPMVAADEGESTDALAHGTLLTDAPLPTRGVVLRPSYDPTERRVTSFEGGMTLATF